VELVEDLPELLRDHLVDQEAVEAQAQAEQETHLQPHLHKVAMVVLEQLIAQLMP
jgi:hypothetical protein